MLMLVYFLMFSIYVSFEKIAHWTCWLIFRYKNEAKWKPLLSVLVKFVTVGGLLGNCLVSGLLLFISHHNYPGGVAFQRIHALLDNQTGREYCFHCHSCWINAYSLPPTLRGTSFLRTLRSDNDDASENVVKKYTPHPFKRFSRFL